ncbi:MAG: bifunctional phosphoserine phosphatase/homoserine phosphotransferase ThrH [Verrucomicrobiota bacterium]
MKPSLLFAFDLESVLVPELWKEVALKYEVEELVRTTRDGLSVDSLYRRRAEICRNRKLKVSDIIEVAEELALLAGAEIVLNWCQSQGQVIVVTDALGELMHPVYTLLEGVSIWDHHALVDDEGFFTGWRRGYEKGKASVIQKAQKDNKYVIAIGDSDNDLAMLRAADRGVLFNSTYTMTGVKNVSDHEELLRYLKANADSNQE